MQRAVTGYHHDEAGGRVAELECGHDRALDEGSPGDASDASDAAPGAPAARLDCGPCDRTEMPRAVRSVRTTAVWDEQSLPAGLRRAHRVAPATWGRLTVHEGRLRFAAATVPPLEVVLEAGSSQSIPPEVEHEVAPLGPVRVSIEFLAVDRATS